MKIFKICTQCKKSYDTYPSNVKKTKNYFCSSTCYGHWQKGKRFYQQGKCRKIRLYCTFTGQINGIKAGCIRKHFGKGYCKYHYYRLIDKPKRNIKIKEKKLLDSNTCFKCSKIFESKYPKKFCSADCRIKPFIIKKGYKKILNKTHPRADKKGYVFEHIIIVEDTVGRNLKLGEEVHHIDGDRGNNIITNLMLFPDHKSHMKFHL